MSRRREAGFTVVELLVAASLFFVAAAGFYQVMLATTRGADTTRDAVRLSEEARLGFNRMVRDTRESTTLQNVTSTSYTIEIDFNGNGQTDAIPSDPAGNYERVTYQWNEGPRTMTVSNGTTTEVLVRGVDCIRKADATCNNVFTYTSSRLEFDADGNGIVSAQELDQMPSIGNGNWATTPYPDGFEPQIVDAVYFAFQVNQGDASSNFYGEAQMRNKR